SRWVVTSAQLAQPDHVSAVCQQLETGAWAGTRDFKVDCIEKKEKKDLQPGAAPAGSPPASTPPRTAARPPPSTPPRAEAAPPLLTPPASAAGPDPAGPDR
ncbi:MAG: hypothetical protein JO361_06970, partial [Gammaproteobacteria bacterium]|nr:hypothetical protein [Gammaproteobacteria bacterium]